MNTVLVQWTLRIDLFIIYHPNMDLSFYYRFFFFQVASIKKKELQRIQYTDGSMSFSGRTEYRTSGKPDKEKYLRNFFADDNGKHIIRILRLNWLHIRYITKLKLLKISIFSLLSPLFISFLFEWQLLAFP